MWKSLTLAWTPLDSDSDLSAGRFRERPTLREYLPDAALSRSRSLFALNQEKAHVAVANPALSIVLPNCRRDSGNSYNKYCSTAWINESAPPLAIPSACS